MIIIYGFLFSALTIFSYGFVDANFPSRLFPVVSELIYNHKDIATGIYVVIVSGLFYLYLDLLNKTRRGKISSQTIWKIIIFSSIILFFSFPAFSYDIFNYMATAKVTFLYKENPYVLMPIEVPNEPLLAFMHAANKVALYGPMWIALTGIPYYFGFGNLMLTLFLFKAFIVVVYFGLIGLVWRMSGKSLLSLVFIALNPLVLMETLVSAHNDIVMMFFSLLSYYLLYQKKILLAVIFFIASILIKFSTLALLPVYVIVIINLWKGRRISWSSVWLYSGVLLLIPFLLSPIREELYPWYFIWPLTYFSLIPQNDWLRGIFYWLSFGLALRFAPYIYTGTWGGVVPIIKKLVTILPPLLFASVYVIKKRL